MFLMLDGLTRAALLLTLVTVVSGSSPDATPPAAQIDGSQAAVHRVTFGPDGSVHAVHDLSGRLVWLNDTGCPDPDEAVALSARHDPAGPLARAHAATLTPDDQIEWLHLELAAKHAALEAAVRTLEACSAPARPGD